MTTKNGAPGKVLVVEDEVLIAADIESVLHERGVREVVTAISVQEAFLLIAQDPPDVAILDYRVRKETTVSLAMELLAMRLPFVFATGFDTGFTVPTELFHIPVVSKPVNADRLMASLYKAMNRTITQSSKGAAAY